MGAKIQRCRTLVEDGQIVARLIALWNCYVEMWNARETDAQSDLSNFDLFPIKQFAA